MHHRILDIPFRKLMPLYRELGIVVSNVAAAVVVVAAWRIVLKMTSAKITLMTLTVTGALIWRLASASPAPYKFVCPLNMSQIRISVLNVPPLTLPGSRGHGEKVTGILGKLFLKIIRKYIHRNCTSFSLNFTQFHITQNFLESISDNEADIAFPITRPQKMWLSSDSYNGPDLIFEEFIESPGYSLIMDVGCFNMKANNIVMKTLVQNTWPIIVFTLLLAGISGMCVWVLVRLAIFTLGNWRTNRHDGQIVWRFDWLVWIQDGKPR